MNRTLTAVVCLLLVSSTVVWRRGDLFSGSLDVVVLGKGLASIVALVLAFGMASRQGAHRLRLGTGTSWFVGVLLVSSVLGAAEHGTLAASAVVAVRVAILVATVVLLLRSAPAGEVLAAVVASCGLFAAVAAGTGSVQDGRLFGGIPPLHPNNLALLAGVVVIWIAWRTVLDQARWPHLVAGGGALALLWLTGSRTGLVMVLAGVAVMIPFVRRIRVGLVIGALLAVAAGALAAVTTGTVGRLVSDFLTRDGTGASTLDSRFVAWQAAAGWADSTWQWTFGGGLSVKLIPVEGQWWNEQLLDSSWVSALVQAGVLGLGTVVLWSLWVLRGAWRAPGGYRVLFLGLAVMLLGRALLESGLFDATPEFLVFVAVSFLAEGGSRGRLTEETEAGRAGEAPVLADGAVR